MRTIIPLILGFVLQIPFAVMAKQRTALDLALIAFMERLPNPLLVLFKLLLGLNLLNFGLILLFVFVFPFACFGPFLNGVLFVAIVVLEVFLGTAGAAARVVKRS